MFLKCSYKIIFIFFVLFFINEIRGLYVNNTELSKKDALNLFESVDFYTRRKFSYRRGISFSEYPYTGIYPANPNSTTPTPECPDSSEEPGSISWNVFYEKHLIRIFSNSTYAEHDHLYIDKNTTVPNVQCSMTIYESHPYYVDFECDTTEYLVLKIIWRNNIIRTIPCLTDYAGEFCRNMITFSSKVDFISAYFAIFNKPVFYGPRVCLKENVCAHFYYGWTGEEWIPLTDNDKDGSNFSSNENSTLPDHQRYEGSLTSPIKECAENLNSPDSGQISWNVFRNGLVYRLFTNKSSLRVVDENESEEDIFQVTLKNIYCSVSFFGIFPYSISFQCSTTNDKLKLKIILPKDIVRTVPCLKDSTGQSCRNVVIFSSKSDFISARYKIFDELVFYKIKPCFTENVESCVYDDYIWTSANWIAVLRKQENEEIIANEREKKYKNKRSLRLRSHHMNAGIYG